MALTSVLADLESSEDSHVDLSGPDHAETLMAAKGRRSRVQCDGFLPRVDEVRVFLAWLGITSHTKHSILGLQDDFHAFRHQGGCRQWNADSKVDVHPILQLSRHPPNDAVSSDA